MAIKRPKPVTRRRRVPPELSVEVPSPEALRALAANARYLGSGEHKSGLWEDIRPSVKNADASKCPTSIQSREEATAMLQTGILAGNISAAQVGGMPQRVWYKGKRGVFEARLTDRSDPTSGKPAGYKAWPEEDPENLPSRPRPIRECHET